MNERALRWVAWLIAAVSIAMAGAAIAIGWASKASVLAGGFGLATVVMGVLFPLCGAVILTRRPKNVVGALFCFIGFWQALEPFSGVYASQALISHPGSLPFGAFMAWLSVWTWAPGFGVAVTFLFLLYPDGSLPSKRWRTVAWLSGAAIVIVTVPLAGATWSTRGAIDLANSNALPLHGFDSAADAVSQIATVAAIPLACVCIVSLWVRMRRASSEQRLQIKWFAYAAVVVVVVVVADGFLTGGSWISALAVPAIPAATAIAIFKYHLYDIDVIISRTLVFGALAALIAALYIGIAVGIGALVGGGGKPNLGLSILATAMVAVGFQPARERLQKMADRLVYGVRATPYEVLAQFSERVAESYASEEVLPRMARVLGEGTSAVLAEVWLRSGTMLRRAAAFPGESAAAGPVQLSSEDAPAMPHADRVVLVRHQDEVLGVLAITKRRGEQPTPLEARLMDDLAHQAGLVLRNVRLTEDLQARLEDLRASRQRLVAAQDTERRRLERNLHDGAQQHLVAIKVKLGLVELLAHRDAAKAKATLAELKHDTDEALETLRDLARGIYPPLLADKGLAAALRSQAAKATLSVVVDAEGLGRYPQETEAALYFCTLEALQNIQKYAAASSVQIRVRDVGGMVSVEITDNGRGFDVKTVSRGAGLTNMEDRLDALGGSLHIDSYTGTGTTVRASVPSAILHGLPADPAPAQRISVNFGSSTSRVATY
jgi:signal transduction histidine kinase